MAVGGVFMYLGATDVQFTANSQKYSLKLPGLIAGSAFLLGGTVFNITRSALYQKPHPRTAWDIALIPSENGIEMVRISWTLRF